MTTPIPNQRKLAVYADADPVWQKQVGNVLKSAGYDVLFTSSKDESKRAITGGKVRLCISTQILPSREGEQIAHYLGGFDLHDELKRSGVFPQFVVLLETEYGKQSAGIRDILHFKKDTSGLEQLREYALKL
ncbi:MAG: hypothetical protein NT120_01970 [Candidatus Aenigmarchaeota archaeon]|nr:hypothetical protein [Candidatus Aenigmarchaeota archaeon]